MAWDVEHRKPPTPLCMRFKISLDKDLYSFLAGIHFHSDRCVAKIYFMTTTVLASNNRMRRVLPPVYSTSQTYAERCKQSAQPWGSG